jgi:hypothetical protein
VLQRRLDAIRRPAYLGRLQLADLELGAAVPLVSSCRVVQQPVGGDGAVWPLLELKVGKSPRALFAAGKFVMFCRGGAASCCAPASAGAGELLPVALAAAAPAAALPAVAGVGQAALAGQQRWEAVAYWRLRGYLTSRAPAALLRLRCKLRRARLLRLPAQPPNPAARSCTTRGA